MSDVSDVLENIEFFGKTELSDVEWRFFHMITLIIINYY